MHKDGSYELTAPDPAIHFDVPNMVLLRKLEPDTVLLDGVPRWGKQSALRQAV